MSGMNQNNVEKYDDEDDFFGNPLKHLLPKAQHAKKDNERVQMKTIMKDAVHPKNTYKRQAITKDDESGETDDSSSDDSDSVLLVEDDDLSKVKREIQELEDFCKAPLRVPGSSAVKSPMKENSRRKMKRKAVDHPELADADLVILDDSTVEAENKQVVEEEESFIIEPSCSIEICDAINFDTQVMRWKMSETFEGLAKVYAAKWSCPLDEVSFSLECGQKVSLTDTPITLVFSEKDVNYLIAHNAGRSSSNQITVNWLLPERDRPITSTIPKVVPFKVLKRDLATDNGLDEKKMNLVFDCQRIGPDETAETIGIEDGDCIDVFITS